MPFINIEKSKRKDIIEAKIDTEKYLGLDSRTRLISYGVSLGIDHPEPISVKNSLSREEYIESNFELKTIITCAAIYHMSSSDDVNDVLSNVNIYNVADECLNRGIDVIEYQIDKYPINSYKLKLIEELDELYELNVKEQ